MPSWLFLKKWNWEFRFKIFGLDSQEYNLNTPLPTFTLHCCSIRILFIAQRFEKQDLSANTENSIFLFTCLFRFFTEQILQMPGLSVHWWDRNLRQFSKQALLLFALFSSLPYKQVHTFLMKVGDFFAPCCWALDHILLLKKSNFLHSKERKAICERIPRSSFFSQGRRWINCWYLSKKLF